MATEDERDGAHDSDDPEEGQEQYGTGEGDTDAAEQTEMRTDSDDGDDDPE